MVFTISEVQKTLFGHLSNYKNFNIHVQLPLSFDLADINSMAKTFISTSIWDENTSIKDLVHTLAYKELNILIIFNIDLLALEFKRAWIFQLANKILEGKMYMPFIHIA